MTLQCHIVRLSGVRSMFREPATRRVANALTGSMTCIHVRLVLVLVLPLS